MPCWELFEEQSEDYRNEVLPPPSLRVLAIEAGVRQGWDRYVGPQGDVICLDRFGASAPATWRCASLGFNVENVLKHAQGAALNSCELQSALTTAAIRSTSE